MARPRQYSDEQILAAARKVFLQHGAKASTQRVADAIGLSQPALFKRFGDKKTLLVKALLPAKVPEFLEALEDGPDPRPIPDQLVEIGVRTLAFLREFVPGIHVLKSAGIEPLQHVGHLGEPPPLRHRRLTTEWLRTAHAQGRVGEQDFAAVAALLLGAIHSRVFLSIHAPTAMNPGSDEEYIHSTVRALWCGLSPQEAR
jgi:AcrR family transcriptional regulator